MRSILLALLTISYCHAFYIEDSNKPSPIGTQSHEQISTASEGTGSTEYPIKKEPKDEPLVIIRSQPRVAVPTTTTPITVQFSEDLRELNPEENAEIRQVYDAALPPLYEQQRIDSLEQPREPTRIVPSQFN
jgi:hypothetical protein